MKIATWNLERPNRAGARVASLMKQIESVGADIWILTETDDRIDLQLQGYTSANTIPIELGHQPTEHRTTIWSRHPILQKIPTHDPETAVCVEIEVTDLKLIVYGTIIPYHAAGAPHLYRSSGSNRNGLKAWELHYESIELHHRDLTEIQRIHPNGLLCFGGDLNQSRDGRHWWNMKREWYGTKLGRNALTVCLDGINLKCLTDEDFFKSGKLKTMSTVDHICLDQRLALRVVEVGAFEAPKLSGKPTSDHNGVWVKLDG